MKKTARSAKLLEKEEKKRKLLLALSRFLPLSLSREEEKNRGRSARSESSKGVVVKGEREKSKNVQERKTLIDKDVIIIFKIHRELCMLVWYHPVCLFVLSPFFGME